MARMYMSYCVYCCKTTSWISGRSSDRLGSSVTERCCECGLDTQQAVHARSERAKNEDKLRKEIESIMEVIKTFGVKSLPDSLVGFRSRIRGEAIAECVAVVEKLLRKAGPGSSIDSVAAMMTNGAVEYIAAHLREFAKLDAKDGFELPRAQVSRPGRRKR